MKPRVIHLYIRRDIEGFKVAQERWTISGPYGPVWCVWCAADSRRFFRAVGIKAGDIPPADHSPKRFSINVEKARKWLHKNAHFDVFIPALLQSPEKRTTLYAEYDRHAPEPIDERQWRERERERVDRFVDALASDSAELRRAARAKKKGKK